MACGMSTTFLPSLRPSAFTTRGTAGIRSSVIDKDGKFVPDTLMIKRDSSLHILNYNSPGATGALPLAAKVAAQILETGVVSAGTSRALWEPMEIAAKMTT